MIEAANFPAPTRERWKLSMDFPSWITRIGTPPARVAALHVVFDALPAEARDYFTVDSSHSFAIDAGWLQTTKPQRTTTAPGKG